MKSNTVQTRGSNREVNGYMKAIGYVRVSTVEQKSQGVSLEAQAEKIELQAKLSDYELIDSIIDAGMSAKSLNRPGIKTIIQMVKAKEVDSIIIYKLDRLSRNVSDLNYLIQLFNKYGVNLIAVKDAIDTQSAGGRMVINMLATISQWEREVIGERTSEALAYKKAQGQKTGGSVPFGYRISGYTSKGNSEVSSKMIPILEPEPTEQEALKLIKKLKNKGYSLSAICRELEKRSIKTKTGRNKWNHNTISRILNKAA